MRDQVVTVFGGTGFIGRHLIRRLAERGAAIRVPTRNPETAGHLRPMGEVGQIVAVASGLGDKAVDRLVQGSTHVVNLIGVLHGDFKRLQARLPGTIAKACAAHAVGHLVQLSAIGADPASPSAYGRSKAAGEAAAKAAMPDVVVLRPSILFGPEDAFFNRFAAMSRFAPSLPLIGGGRTRFQPVYVGDVADAVLVGLGGSVPGRTFELGGPRVYTFKELMAYLLKVLERPRLLAPVPWSVAELQARVLELLPDPPLTRDQVQLLKRDNVVAQGAATLADLGITPTALEGVVPRYLRPIDSRTGRVPLA